MAQNLPVRIVKSHCVNHVVVLVEREQFFACVRIPDLASAIVGASDEFVTGFVECAIRQRQQMGAKHLEQRKLLFLVLLLLFNQL